MRTHQEQSRKKHDVKSMALGWVGLPVRGHSPYQVKAIIRRDCCRRRCSYDATPAATARPVLHMIHTFVEKLA